jgi:hypothetical protein
MSVNLEIYFHDSEPLDASFLESRASAGKMDPQMPRPPQQRREDARRGATDGSLAALRAAGIE